MKYVVRSVDGDEYGPFSREELQNLVREDRLGPGDFIRREAGRTWSPFEKIPGLGDNVELLAGEPPAESPRKAPTRPTVGAEVVANGRPETPSLDPATTKDAEESTSETPLAPEPETVPAGDRGTASARANPFLAHGLPITLDVDEEVHFVAGQSFLDAFRESIFNAVLGHRATMICTSRRVVVVRPSSLRASMQIAWIDATGMAAIERRRNLFRMVVGVVLLFYAISSLAGGMLSGFAAGLAGGSGIDGSILSMASSAGLIIASVAGLLGLLAILTASRRAMVVSCSGSEVLFCCMAMGPWHLAQIDAARQSLPSDAPSSKGRIAPPTTFEGG